MKSLEELRQIKERALQRRKLSGKDSRARVVVAMGTCGIAAGARDTMSAILTELERRHIANVVVTQTGCPGLCEYEPIVQVQIGDQDIVTYGNIGPDRVAVLIQEHIAGGAPVEKWQLTG
jgi:NADP-reducing hydrogenase subunit HndB